jgi:glutathione S-transferase
LLTLSLFYLHCIEGEPIRLLCKYAGMALEDVRLTREEFSAKKLDGTLRFGQMPALELEKNGKPFVLTQTASIMRYIAKVSGNNSLYPTDDHAQAALIDSIIEAESGKRLREFVL